MRHWTKCFIQVISFQIHVRYDKVTCHKLMFLMRIIRNHQKIPPNLFEDIREFLRQPGLEISRNYTERIKDLMDFHFWMWEELWGRSIITHRPTKNAGKKIQKKSFKGIKELLKQVGLYSQVELTYCSYFFFFSYLDVFADSGKAKSREAECCLGRRPTALIELSMAS